MNIKYSSWQILNPLELYQNIRAIMADDGTNEIKEGTSDFSYNSSPKRAQFRGHIQAIFDASNFQVLINGELIDYDKQTLSQKGLQINLNNTNNKQSHAPQILIAGNNSLEFDRRYTENKYCIQLANTIDRGSNSAYHKMKNYKRSIFNSRQTVTPFYSLQICELAMKKIPIKPRCFQTVFKKIPSHKIKILFQNDSFFIQVVKFFCKVNFKVDIDAIYLNQNNANKEIIQNLQQQSSFYNQNSQSSQQERKFDKKDKNEEAAAKCNNKTNKKIIISSLTDFEKKAIKIYQHICAMLKSAKFCYERINLLIGTFHRQNRLSNFLYQLNRQQICQQLTNYLPQIYKSSDSVEKLLTSKKTNSSEQNSIKLSQLQVLNYTVQIIKTINLSLNKSQVAFKIINTYLLSQKHLPMWLGLNFSKFIQNNDLNLKLIQLLALISQFSPIFISNIYCNHHFQINQILSKHVKWIYYTIESVHQNEEKQQKLRKIATNSLDNLIFICKSTIKETISSVNIGRVICKQICETATNLRAKDIQFLTIVCCVNVFSRQSVMRYLFVYFTKFIKSVKKLLAGPKHLTMNSARKNKHYMIEIMQSIRKISEIQSIDFAIDSQLLSDIEEILKAFSLKHEKMRKLTNSNSWKGDCTFSVYQAMLKNLKIERPQEKDSRTYDSEYQNQNKQ